jgi:hypothetical protein
LDAYLGSGGARIPFGGRHAELDELTSWLEDPNSPHNFLITAPAGRGKTALVVRWIEQLGHLRPEIPVAFVPISIRYDTNQSSVFYQALAARLAHLLDEKLPADSATGYKERVREYLDRFTDPTRPCLVVIDGLDEATGWVVDKSVLPPRPPAGLRILASARQLAGDKGSADWLRRLGWTFPLSEARTMEVRPLDRAGIADVLQKMGSPLDHLSGDVDIIGELHRLTSGGDPLLLALYVYDLLKAGDAPARLSPSDLRTRKPGFGNYFKDWFEEQQKAWVDARQHVDIHGLNLILATLGCAQGPLSLADISNVVKTAAPAVDMITTLDTLAPVKRFIIGDGIETGFVLSHPKLAEYFRNEHFAGSDIISRVDAAYTTWGERIVAAVNEKKIDPADVSRYLLVYYVQHLGQQKPVPLGRYRALAENGWRLAWQHYEGEGGFRGFAQQIETTWNKLLEATQQDPEQLKRPSTGLGGLIRCALCLSSARSIGTSIPPNFLSEMVKNGLIGKRQALYFAKNRDDRDRAAAMSAIAPHLDMQLDAPVLLEAVTDGRQIRSSEARARALAALSRRLPPDHRYLLMEEALIDASGTASSRAFIRSGDEAAAPPVHMLREVLDAAVGMSAEQIEALLQVTERFVSRQALSWDPDEAAQRAAMAEAPKRLLPKTLSAQPLHPQLEGQSTEFFKPGPLLRVIERIQQLVTGLPEKAEAAIAVACQTEERDSWTAAIHELLSLLPERELEDVLREALTYTGTEVVDVVELLLPHLTPAMIDSATIRIAESGYPTWGNAGALRILASRATHTALASALGTIFRRDFDQKEFLALIGGSLPRDLMREAIAAIIKPDLAWDAEHQLAALAPYFDTALTEEVWTLIAKLSWTYSYQREKLFESVAPILSGQQRETLLQSALAKATDWERQELHVDQLKALIPHLSPQDLAGVLDSVLAPERPDRNREINALAPYLTQDQLRSVLYATIARDERWTRKSVLEAVLPAMAPELCEEAITAVAKIPEASERVEAVDVLLPYLDESQRRAAVADAYRVALEIHDETPRAVVLAALGQHSQGPEPDMALSACKAALGDIRSKEDQAFALGLISVLPQAPKDLARNALEQSLSLAPTLREELGKLALRLLAACSPQATSVEASMLTEQVIKSISDAGVDEQERIMLSALITVSPHVSSDILVKLVSEVSAYTKRDDCDEDTAIIATGLLSLSPQLPQKEALEVTSQSLALIAETDLEKRLDDNERIALTALTALSPNLSNLEVEVIISNTRRWLGGSLNERRGDFAVLGAAMLPYGDENFLREFGPTVIQCMPTMQRSELLSLLAAFEGRWGDTIGLRPALGGGAGARGVLERLGGQSALPETITAIIDTSCWWP